MSKETALPDFALLSLYGSEDCLSVLLFLRKLTVLHATDTLEILMIVSHPSIT